MFSSILFIQGAHPTPEVGCFFKMCKIHFFCCFITQLVKKLHQWSLHEVIKDILPFVLNTKRPLSDIWLLRYKQNSFGCFQRNLEVRFIYLFISVILDFRSPSLLKLFAPFFESPWFFRRFTFMFVIILELIFVFYVLFIFENSDLQAGIWFGSLAQSPIITFPPSLMV